MWRFGLPFTYQKGLYSNPFINHPNILCCYPEFQKFCNCIIIVIHWRDIISFEVFLSTFENSNTEFPFLTCIPAALNFGFYSTSIFSVLCFYSKLLQTLHTDFYPPLLQHTWCPNLERQHLLLTIGIYCSIKIPFKCTELLIYLMH